MKRGILLGVVLDLVAGGSAFAGPKWLITSTTQIKPSVLVKLRGARGPKGAAGAEGPPGPAGAFSSADESIVDGTHEELCAYTPATSTTEQHTCAAESVATCPGDAVVISGGFTTDTDAAQLDFYSDYPEPPTSWAVGATNYGATQMGFTAYALCAKVG